MNKFNLLSYPYWRIKLLSRVISWETRIASDLTSTAKSKAARDQAQEMARESLFYILLIERIDLQLVKRYILSPQQTIAIEGSSRVRAHEKTLLHIIRVTKRATREASGITFRKNQKEPNAKYFFRSLAVSGFPVLTPDEWQKYISEKLEMTAHESMVIIQGEFNDVIRRLLNDLGRESINSASALGSPERNFEELFAAFAETFALECPGFYIEKTTSND
jgi:hypothetical protein